MSEQNGTNEPKPLAMECLEAAAMILNNVSESAQAPGSSLDQKRNGRALAAVPVAEAYANLGNLAVQIEIAGVLGSIAKSLTVIAEGVPLPVRIEE